MTTKNGECYNCKRRSEFILHLQLFANGSEHFIWVCSVCNARNPNRSKNYFIDSEKVRGFLSEDKIRALPIIIPDLSQRCVRCGKREAELHHWAPKGIFGDKEAEQWPKDYLCKNCHELWHVKVTPKLVKEEFK